MIQKTFGGHQVFSLISDKKKHLLTAKHFHQLRIQKNLNNHRVFCAIFFNWLLETFGDHQASSIFPWDNLIVGIPALY